MGKMGKWKYYKNCKNEKKTHRETTLRPPLRRPCAMEELLTPIRKCGSYGTPTHAPMVQLQQQVQALRSRSVADGSGPRMTSVLRKTCSAASESERSWTVAVFGRRRSSRDKTTRGSSGPRSLRTSLQRCTPTQTCCRNGLQNGMRPSMTKTQRSRLELETMKSETSWSQRRNAHSSHTDHVQ